METPYTYLIILLVQTNAGKDLEQNRPGRTKFRSPAVKKPKSEDDEVSRTTAVP